MCIRDRAPTVKVPESAIKKETLQKETFQMEVPAFMNKDKKEEKPSQPFAIPAFKLTDLPDKDKQ